MVKLLALLISMDTNNVPSAVAHFISTWPSAITDWM